MVTWGSHILSNLHIIILVLFLYYRGEQTIRKRYAAQFHRFTRHDLPDLPDLPWSARWEVFETLRTRSYRCDPGSPTTSGWIFMMNPKMSTDVNPEKKNTRRIPVLGGWRLKCLKPPTGSNWVFSSVPFFDCNNHVAPKHWGANKTIGN